MAKFTGKAVMTVHQLAVDHNSASDTSTERDHNEVFHTTGCSVSHLPDCRRIGVVGQCYGNTHPLFQHLSKRNNTLPAEVGRKLNATGEIVAVWRSGSDSLDLFFGGDVLDHIFNHLSQLIEIVFHIGMFGSF